MMLVDNADGFWTGLPKAKPVKKVSVNMGMTKEQREAHRLTKLEKQAKDLNQKIADKKSQVLCMQPLQQMQNNPSTSLASMSTNASVANAQQQ